MLNDKLTERRKFLVLYVSGLSFSELVTSSYNRSTCTNYWNIWYSFSEIYRYIVKWLFVVLLIFSPVISCNSFSMSLWCTINIHNDLMSWTYLCMATSNFYMPTIGPGLTRVYDFIKWSHRSSKYTMFLRLTPI